MRSLSRVLSTGVSAPFTKAEDSMLPFDLSDLSGVPARYLATVKDMLKGIKALRGRAFLTVHGQHVAAGTTHRRPGAHTDGNYVNFKLGESFLSFGSGGGCGWKVGDDGKLISGQEHIDSYDKLTGGILLLSSHTLAKGYTGDFEGAPKQGGDCSHLLLGEGFDLEAGRVYYGNNHFVHEALVSDAPIERVMYRVTLPEDHAFELAR